MVSDFIYFRYTESFDFDFIYICMHIRCLTRKITNRCIRYVLVVLLALVIFGVSYVTLVLIAEQFNITQMHA